MSSQLLQNFNSSVNSIRPIIQSYSKVPVRLSSIRKTGRTFSWNDNKIEDTALKDLLNIFSVKDTLIDDIKSDTDQWEPLHRCISDIKDDKTVTAIQCKTDGVSRVVRFSNTSIDNESVLDLDKGIDLIGTYLDTQSDKVILKKFGFNSNTLQIEAQFQNTDCLIDVFGDGNDLWNTGFEISYGETKSQISPHLLRLLCTNGLTATHLASQRYFESRDFKQGSFNKLINKVIDRDLSDIVMKSSALLRNNKASLREFYNARNTLARESNELAGTYFNDDAIKDAYKGIKLNQKNKRWLSTANTNINAYDFFNQITHCVSHQNIQDTTRLQLNNLASEIFLKGPDFTYRAPDPFLTSLN